MNDSSPEGKTFVQVITHIPIIGEYITTLLALGPPFLASAAIFGWGKETRGAMLLFAVLSLPWIYWLQRKGRITIILPLIRIPIIYLTPLWFLIGLGKFI
jgi:hypothetical protein